MLAIAASALRAVNGSCARAALANAAAFVDNFCDRLRISCNGNTSAVGLREQLNAIRLIEAIVQATLLLPSPLPHVQSSEGWWWPLQPLLWLVRSSLAPLR